MDLKFYYCEVCGKVVTVLSDTNVPTICCGKPMQLLSENVTDGALEKHVPVFCQEKNTVKVKIGSEKHPMTDEHYIVWIGLKTERGFQFKCLRPGDSPKLKFKLTEDDDPETVYAYCNIHGLWKATTEDKNERNDC